MGHTVVLAGSLQTQFLHVGYNFNDNGPPKEKLIDIQSEHILLVPWYIPGKLMVLCFLSCRCTFMLYVTDRTLTPDKRSIWSNIFMLTWPGYKASYAAAPPTKDCHITSYRFMGGKRLEEMNTLLFTTLNWHIGVPLYDSTVYVHICHCKNTKVLCCFDRINFKLHQLDCMVMVETPGMLVL